MKHNILKMKLKKDGVWKEEYPIFQDPVSESTAQKTAESLMRSVKAQHRSDVTYIIVKDLG